MQILKDIYMVLGGPYSNIANIFIIKNHDSLVVMDTAEEGFEYDIIKENMAYWGLDQYPVTHILISHKHKNHIGNIWRFRQDYPNVVVVAGDKDSDAIEKGITNEICDFFPFPKKEDYVPQKVDMRVKDLDTFEAAGIKFTVYEVPGHTDGSVFYQFEWEGKSVWLTGDVLNIEKDCDHAFLGWEGGMDYNRSLFYESVKRFSKFEGDIILPGHYQLCMQNATEIFNDSYRIPLEEWRIPGIDHE